MRPQPRRKRPRWAGVAAPFLLLAAATGIATGVAARTTGARSDGHPEGDVDVIGCPALAVNRPGQAPDGRRDDDGDRAGADRHGGRRLPQPGEAFGGAGSGRPKGNMMGSKRTFIGRRTHLGWAAAACLAMAPNSQAAGPGLVFSVRTWDGEYASRDVPGGVESTPTVGSIYTVNADGTGLRQLVPPGPGVDFPAASPDGKWVYYQAGARGKTEVYRCRRDGTGATRLTPPDRLTERLKGGPPFTVKEAFGYALSADGTKMVFTAHDGATGRAVVAGADGSSPAFVAPGLGYTYMARLGPKNDRVVFSGPARGYRLLLATLPDGKPVELTPDHPDCFVPRFTPDGKTVVFVRRDGDVYRVGADGKDLRRLTDGNRYVEFRLSAADKHGSTDGPDVSPDGKRVAFVAVKDGVPNVFVVGVDGRDRQQVTARTAPCGRVQWSPDGKRLSFVSLEGKYPQLFVVPAAGGEPKQLTKLDGGVNFATWLPE